MNNEFQEKLQLYKEGKLNRNEVAEIECEINKFNALWDYLGNEDKELLDELKQQIPAGYEENRPIKHLKRRVNLRVLMLTVISVFSVLIVFVFLYFLTSNITTSLFALDHKEAYVKREAIVQLTQMFHPQYESNGSGVESSLFAQQTIRVSLDNTVGNTKIDETEINVRYSFGKPVRSKTAVTPPFLPIEDFSLINSHESDPISGFKILEKAPQGTIAKIFVEFNKALTPRLLKENFIDQISKVNTTPLEITPLVAIGSEFVLANPSYYQFTPVFPYDSKNAKQLKGNDLLQKQYENLEDQAHSESFINNLNLIKSNKGLLQIMYFEDMFENIDIDNIIKQVENNGVEYVGMYISADSKELLKLKDNPMIHCLRVESIVVW